MSIYSCYAGSDLLHRVYVTTTRAYVTNNATHVVVGSGNGNLHDRLGKNGISTSHSLLERHRSSDLEPNETGKGYEFINAVTGGAIPKEYIPAVDQGIQGAMQTGVLAGYNVVDCKVTLFDGSYHEVDSSEMAFKIAGSMAFKEAMRKADPVLTEPIMKVSVTTPDDYMGSVIGDVSSRRGNVDSMEQIAPGVTRVYAHVPLAQMFGYATTLRSMSQGRAVYVMEPDGFQDVPKSIQEEIVKARAK